eukprot:m.167185 g.167185  ORF g.167185 m.167185 type:complete len:371 (-) comp24085_c0_seq2:261-1373(-)
MTHTVLFPYGTQVLHDHCKPAHAVHAACEPVSITCGPGAMSSNRAMERVATLIKSGNAHSIVVLTGAGVSTGAGIPDFRSPGGMYATLKPELITASSSQRRAMKGNPQYVVEKSLFFANQFPYMEVRRPFVLGTQQQQWKATISHWFIRFLDEDKLLTTLFTQNIDGLDYQTGLTRSKAINVHGSLAVIKCEGCNADADFEAFCDQVQTNVKDIYGVDPTAPKESTNILCQSCGKPLVKPNTVLFGGSLPEEFFARSESDAAAADLLIVAGTSLQVSPANSLVYKVSDKATRVLINRERVGEELGLDFDGGEQEGRRDLFLGGNCDETFLQLMSLLEWLPRLEAVRDQLPEGNQQLLDAALQKAEHMRSV